MQFILGKQCAYKPQPPGLSDESHTPRRARGQLTATTGYDNFVGPHHLVVLVFENMAVPDVAAGESLERNNDPRDHAWVGADRVFPAGLRRSRRNSRAGEADRPFVLKFESVERPAVEYLKPHQVQMNRVSVFRQIHHPPDL